MGVRPDIHYILTDYGIKKEYHKDYNDEVINEFFELISSENCETELINDK